MYEDKIILLLNSTWESIVMTVVSGFFGLIIGMPLGILLFITKKGQIKENRKINTILSIFVNIFRSIPFIILIVWMIPFTRFVVGTSIGTPAALVPLSVGVAPFIARMIENSLLEVPNGLIEASRAMGATTFQIIQKVLLPEALPSIINCITITLITLLGYSAMGGVVGAGGLGKIGFDKGFVTRDAFIMNSVIVILILLVFIIQSLGNYFSKKVNHR